MEPQGLEIGEKTTVKIRNKRNFVFYPWFEFLNEHWTVRFLPNNQTDNKRAKNIATTIFLLTIFAPRPSLKNILRLTQLSLPLIWMNVFFLLLSNTEYRHCWYCWKRGVEIRNIVIDRFKLIEFYKKWLQWSNTSTLVMIFCNPQWGEDIV